MRFSLQKLSFSKALLILLISAICVCQLGHCNGKHATIAAGVNNFNNFFRVYIVFRSFNIAYLLSWLVLSAHMLVCKPVCTYVCM